MLIKKAILRIACLMVVLSVLTACSSIDSALDTKTGISYENNRVVKAMEVPSDLTPPEFDNTLELPAIDESQAALNKNVFSDLPPDIDRL